MKARSLLPVLNIVAVLITIIVNALANIVPFNGRTTGEISDSFNLLFVPAGYVFSIWGLIYLGLIVFAVFQALPSEQNNPAVRATDGWFLLSCLANALWIVFWHYGYYGLTLVMMLTLLVSLVRIYPRLQATALSPDDRWTRWAVLLPFSLYLGWISVATVANVSAVLVDAGWTGGGLSPVFWTMTMMVVATGLALLMSYRHGDVAYTGVLIWALTGIAIKQSASLPIVITGGLSIVIALAGLMIFRQRMLRLAHGLAR